MTAKSLGQKGRGLTLSCKRHGKERHKRAGTFLVLEGLAKFAISAEIGDCLSLGLPRLLHLLAKARLLQDLKEELVGFPTGRSQPDVAPRLNLNIHPDVQQ